ncbi:2-aminoethanethiol dioxygenase [Periplaneta americana]|uniref:2-aminoethanethiol dioxygenase n=1 Tax=Periplaneta americana TaxID=6978 RepID=UPI0037E996AB
MATLIERVVRQALRTFSRRQSARNSPSEADFQKLVTMAGQLTAADVNLNIGRLQVDEPRESSPPVIYINVYEDPHVTIGIFIVKSGEKLPLHDHPQMYGILKVIEGTVKIQSYSIIPNGTIVQSASGDKHLFSQTFCAEKLPETTVNASDGACFLTPTERNLHEIYSVNGAAAFLDILSPPYDTSDGKDRSCHYFREQGTGVGDETRLIVIPNPPEYWNGVANYEGPRIRPAWE